MRLLTIFLVFGMMVVSGCSFLDPKPDSSRYFLLRPMAEPGSVPALDELVLGLGPVTVPDYLDRIDKHGQVLLIGDAPASVHFLRHLQSHGFQGQVYGLSLIHI